MTKIQLTRSAQENVEETGCDPQADLAALQSGAHTRESLLAFCLNGADDDRVEGWREYVDTLVALANQGNDRSMPVGDHVAARIKKRQEQEQLRQAYVADLADRWIWYQGFGNPAFLSRSEGWYLSRFANKRKAKALYAWLVERGYLYADGTVTERAYREVVAEEPDLAPFVRQGPHNRPGVLMYADDDEALSLAQRKWIAEHADQYTFLRWNVFDRKSTPMAWGALGWGEGSSSNARLLVTNAAYARAVREAFLDDLMRQERPSHVPAAMAQAAGLAAEDRRSLRNAVAIDFGDGNIFQRVAIEMWPARVAEQLIELRARREELDRRITLLAAADAAIATAEGGWPAFLERYERDLRAALAQRLDAQAQEESERGEEA